MNQPAEKFLLLCTDAQTTLTNAIPDSTPALNRCRFAISAAQLLGIPTLFTEQVPAKLGPTDPALLAAAGSSANILSKSTFSALDDPAIRDFIQRHLPARILLCGFELPICIYQTAIDALAQNIPLTLLTDATAARRTQDTAAVLAQLRHAGASTLPSEAVFYQILHSAQHPAFKSFTQLVKNS